MSYSYGGQALIEGVMMRGKRTQAMAVRQDDGTIVSEVEPIEPWMDKHPFFRLPFVRGTVNMLESIVVGMKALTWSTNANLTGGEEPEEELKPWQIALTMAFSLSLGIALFFLLPVFLANLTRPIITGVIAQNILEGVIRVGVFLLYLFLITRMKEIHRVFQYHGAEHKSIHCYEQGVELTPENAARFSCLHPRCGTSFLFLVMIVSIFIFSFVGVDNIALRFVSRVVLLPVVAGVSYEVLKYCGKHMDKAWVRVVAWPGMQLQRLTTAEPDKDMLEVAIFSLQKVRSVEEDPALDPELRRVLPDNVIPLHGVRTAEPRQA